MKFRSSLLLAPVVAGLTLGTLAPAQAAPTDPVTNLTVSVAQAPGSHDSWKVTASWDANVDVTAYRVIIADHADGTVTSGAYYGNQDTDTVTVGLTTARMAAGVDYTVVVRPIKPVEGAETHTAFTAPALDTTAPTGTYKLDRASGYLEGDLFSEEMAADFRITQTSLDGPATRKVLAGDGTPAKAWASGTGFVVSYSKPGLYTPHVLLTDEFANTRDVQLSPVRVLKDTIAPKITLTTPDNPGKAASWRVIRGTASDVGSGLAIAGVFVVEKRDGIWWAYDFRKRTWLEGLASLDKTMAKSKARPWLVEAPAPGAWRTPAIRGLQKGTLHVEAVAVDNVFNFGQAQPVHRRVR